MPEAHAHRMCTLDRNGQLETIAHLDSVRPPQKSALCGAVAQQRAMRGSLLSPFELIVASREPQATILLEEMSLART